MSAKKIIFVTGTDTGVGKTVLTGLLLYHFRQGSGRTLAMKPFCSGGLEDVRLLQALQPGELTDSEMNPYYFSKPVAPFAAAKQNKLPQLSEVVRSINKVKNTCDQLIVEGSGGLLVPLGKDYSVADLIKQLNCRVIIAARNKLGTINHTLLTIHALKANGIRTNCMSVVLMDSHNPDPSTATNKQFISGLAPGVSVFGLPHLEKSPITQKKVSKNHTKIIKVLENLAKAAKRQRFK